MHVFLQCNYPSTQRAVGARENYLYPGLKMEIHWLYEYGIVLRATFIIKPPPNPPSHTHTYTHTPTQTRDYFRFYRIGNVSL